MPELDVSPVQFKVRAKPLNRVGVSPTSRAKVILVPVPGGQGPTGPAGDNSPVYNEVLSGALNGINTAFSTANDFKPGSTRVCINGLREQLGIGYTETGPAQITFDDPPLPDDILTIDYVIA